MPKEATLPYPWTPLLRRFGAMPSPALYLDKNDVVACTVWTYTATTLFTVSGYFLTPEGEVQSFSQSLSVTVATNSGYLEIAPGECMLLSVVVSVDAGAVNAGDAFAALQVYQGPPTYALLRYSLLHGSVTAQAPLGFPGSTLTAQGAGAGSLVIATGTNPAAGAEAQYQISATARVILRGAAVTLVTSATAANRRTHLLITSGATTLLDLPSATLQTASLTRTYYAAPFPFAPAAVGTVIYLPLPAALPLPASAIIKTSTDAIEADDDYGALTVYLEYFPEV
jgi:hypothetical protein